VCPWRIVSTIFAWPTAAGATSKVVLAGVVQRPGRGVAEACGALEGLRRSTAPTASRRPYKNLAVEARKTSPNAMRPVCHYGMTPTRNNRGVGHENGAVESPTGTSSAHRPGAIAAESAISPPSTTTSVARRLGRALQPPLQRGLAMDARAPGAAGAAHHDYSEQVVAVTTSSTIESGGCSTASRASDRRAAALHIFDERIEAFVGATQAVVLPRVYAVNHERHAGSTTATSSPPSTQAPGVPLLAAARGPAAERYLPCRSGRSGQPPGARAACKASSHPRLAACADCNRPWGLSARTRSPSSTSPVCMRLNNASIRAPCRRRRRSTALHGAQHPLSLYDSLLPSTARRRGCTDMVQDRHLTPDAQAVAPSSIARHWQACSPRRTQRLGQRPIPAALCEQELTSATSRRIAATARTPTCPRQEPSQLRLRPGPGPCRGTDRALASSAD